jgi:hypothetical protein
VLLCIEILQTILNFNIKTNVVKFSIWKRMVAMTANYEIHEHTTAS